MVWVTGSMVMQMLGCGGGGGSQMVQCDDGLACRWCGVWVDGVTGGVVLGWVGS